MDINIGNDWDEILKEEFEKDYFVGLMRFLDNEYENKEIYPKKTDVFRALKNTEYKDVKVVILGQDPYHGIGQANGLSFSVNEGMRVPPSLRNIHKEINEELGIDNTNKGDLSKWTEQGILLLNTVLTVEKDRPNSHKGIGWENFTDSIISKLNNKKDKVVFLLWGAQAQDKKNLIGDNHIVLRSTHPSPLSAYRGFFGCGHFKKVNEIMKKEYKYEIEWKL